MRQNRFLDGYYSELNSKKEVNFNGAEPIVKKTELISEIGADVKQKSRMKRLGLMVISALICGVAFTFMGCKEKGCESHKEKVSLMESDKGTIFEKAVVLYEDEKYLVKTPLPYFLNDMEERNGYYHGYNVDTAAIISDGKTSNLLYLSSYFEKSLCDDTTTDFLRSGQCYIYNKKTKGTIKKIVVEHKDCHYAPLVGHGEINFYINNVLFLSIGTWIS